MMDETTRRLSRLYRRTARPQANCPSSSQLASLAQGSTWPWQRRKLADHLAECPHCSAEFRSILAVREGLNDALGDFGGRTQARPGWIAFGSAGACAALLAAVLLLPQARTPGAPGGIDGDVLFASDFAPTSAAAPDDTLFRGDFDGQIEESRPDTLFKSNFGNQS